ncbi:MAG: DUF4111 domain-containing protein [Caldilineaceae bacterium]|nr:DUF4111 domain-containing protein [Caldilineaceae bacterium]
MSITPYPDIDELLQSLLDQIQHILKTKLRGLYLYGSLVTGDFDRDISDIDLVAVLASDVDNTDFARLQKMHHDFAAAHPTWDDRIEVAYLSADALKTFRSQLSKMAAISPGEPFNLKDAGRDWLINWWVVREKGVTLFGPPPTTFIDPISKEEFLQVVQDHIKYWLEWVYQMERRPSQAYVILTMCRALYAFHNGAQVSKRQAAQWVQERYPQWAPLIREALVWRAAWQDKDVDHAATLPAAVSFVHFAASEILPK